MDERYPDDWDERRREVYSRDGYTCQNCGAGGGRKGNSELHAHHIVPISKGGSHKKSNLTTLCSDCHESIHSDKMAPTSKQGRNSRHNEFTIPESRSSSVGQSEDTSTEAEAEANVYDKRLTDSTYLSTESASEETQSTKENLQSIKENLLTILTFVVGFFVALIVFGGAFALKAAIPSIFAVAILSPISQSTELFNQTHVLIFGLLLFIFEVYGRLFLK